jgi:glycosyltransferase involved in cell wall biosynthesis
VAARLQSSLFIPDGRIGWYPFAVRLGQRVLRAEQPSAVFSTSAPYTAHLIARRLAASADLPWVLDLRDPWVDNHFDPPPTRWHRHLHRWLEGRCVDRANRVVCVTPSMTDEMRNRYPGELQSKFATITNGFDPKDFDRELAPDPTRFSIRHVGSLYAGRSAIPFLRGLLLAMARDAALQARLDVEFIGAMDRDNRQAWEAFVAAHELQPWVSSRAFVPHHHAVGLMQQSQVQLLIAGKGLGLDRVYTAKLFEYLGARRPILAVAPPGVAATLIQESGAGIVADPESPEDIADAILTLYSWYRQGRLREWSPQGIEAYDRCHLTGQLASLLNALVEQEHA